MESLLAEIDALLRLDGLEACEGDRNGSSFREDFEVYVVAASMWFAVFA